VSDYAQLHNLNRLRRLLETCIERSADHETVVLFADQLGHVLNQIEAAQACVWVEPRGEWN